MMFQMMSAQPVLGEIVAGNAHHGVDVVEIGGESGVGRDDRIVLDQNGGPMDAIVHGFANLGRPHPRKVDLLNA